MPKRIRMCTPRRVAVDAAFCDTCEFHTVFISCPHMRPASRPRSFCLERCSENENGKCRRANLAPVETVWMKDKQTRETITAPGCSYPVLIPMSATYNDESEAERIEV